MNGSTSHPAVASSNIGRHTRLFRSSSIHSATTMAFPDVNSRKESASHTPGFGSGCTTSTAIRMRDLSKKFTCSASAAFSKHRQTTRLTSGFSKKLENHEHALTLYFMHYNFCRIHRTLRVTSAMEAGITDHVWSLDEVIDLP